MLLYLVQNLTIAMLAVGTLAKAAEECKTGRQYCGWELMEDLSNPKAYLPSFACLNVHQGSQSLSSETSTSSRPAIVRSAPSLAMEALTAPASSNAGMESGHVTSPMD
jgi:hypothetical protein